MPTSGCGQPADLLRESQVGQLPHGVRQEGNAYTELTHPDDALKDNAGHAATLQVQRERQAADPAADDRDHVRMVRGPLT